MKEPTEGLNEAKGGEIMGYTFTQEQYTHIKEKGFNPGICNECREIDVVLRNLSANAPITSELYEALKALVINEQECGIPEGQSVIRARKALAKVEGK